MDALDNRFFNQESNYTFLTFERNVESSDNQLTITNLFRADFELLPGTYTHTREVYFVLDFIGDVGGLFDGLNLLCRMVISVLTFLGMNP